MKCDNCHIRSASIHITQIGSDFKKEINVFFNGVWSRERVRKFGKIKKSNEHEVVLEVEPGEAARVAAELVSKFPVQDIGIASQPLEKIIEAIYEGI